jgi:hypothetical protein
MGIDIRSLSPVTEDDFENSLTYREKKFLYARPAGFGENIFLPQRNRKIQCAPTDIVIFFEDDDRTIKPHDVVSLFEYNTCYRKYKSGPNGSDVVFCPRKAIQCPVDRAITDENGRNLLMITHGDYAVLDCDSTGKIKIGWAFAPEFEEHYIPCDPESGKCLCNREVHQPFALEAVFAKQFADYARHLKEGR